MNSKVGQLVIADLQCDSLELFRSGPLQSPTGCVSLQAGTDALGEELI